MSADATDVRSVAALFAAMEEKLGPLDIVLYNAAARVSGAIPDLDPLDRTVASQEVYSERHKS